MAQQPTRGIQEERLPEKLKACCVECEDCARVCRETLAYCLEKGGKHVEARHIQLLLDCTTICVTCDDFTARQSPNHQRLMQLCAEVCDACAESCESFKGDKQMERCAEACRSCARQCRQAAGR